MKQVASRACFMLASCLAYALALKMEATYSSDMSVDFEWTTWFYIPKEELFMRIYCPHIIKEVNEVVKHFTFYCEDGYKVTTSGLTSLPSHFLFKRRVPFH
jgi:hypothetical protein